MFMYILTVTGISNFMPLFHFTQIHAGIKLNSMIKPVFV